MTSVALRLGVRILLGGLLVAALVALWLIGHTIYLVTEHEADYVSACQAVELTTYFIRERDAWPRSWEELEGFNQTVPELERGWPTDLSQMRERVEIDFNFSPMSQKTLSRAEFHAIQPKQANSLFNDKELTDVRIETLLLEIKRCGENDAY